MHFNRGCAIPSMIRESRILHEVVSQVVEERLLEIDVSYVGGSFLRIITAYGEEHNGWSDMRWCVASQRAGHGREYDQMAN